MSLDCTSQFVRALVMCGEVATSNIDDHNLAHPLTSLRKVNTT